MEGSSAGIGVELPRYRCHKEVWALKIKEIRPGRADKAQPGATIVPVEANYAPFSVGEDFMSKHKPQAGGYYVVYKDGYASFSPAAAFEEGYTRILPGYVDTTMDSTGTVHGQPLPDIRGIR